MNAPRSAAILEFGAQESGIGQIRDAVEAHLRVQCTWVDRSAVILVLSELLSNAVRHASGWLGLRVAADERRLVVEVSDASPEPPHQREPDYSGNSGGLGLHLVAKLTSRLEVAPDAAHGGKTVRAIWLRAERGGPAATP